MSLGEKIGRLRKERYWSQEDLADRMEVSRQSVSKWESDQSVPDIDKIVRLSDLFGVSLDYLLRDSGEEQKDPEAESGIESGWEEIVQAEPPQSEKKKKKSRKEEEPYVEDIRMLSAEEVEGYLGLVERTAGWTAGAVSLCVFSPVVLIVLLGMNIQHIWGIGETAAAGTGVVILLLLVCVAVGIFVLNGQTMSQYEYMEKENVCMPDFCREEIRRRRQEFEGTYRGSLVAGVVLCVLSAIPVVAAAFMGIPVAVMYATALLLVLVGVGAFWLVRSGLIRSGYEKLLQEGDYTEAKKRKNRRIERISGYYWEIVTVVYLLVSFRWNAWGRSWLIWPCAAILFPMIEGILFGEKEKH